MINLYENIPEWFSSSTCVLLSLLIGFLSTIVFTNNILLGICLSMMIVIMFVTLSKYKEESSEKEKAADYTLKDPTALNIIISIASVILHVFLPFVLYLHGVFVVGTSAGDFNCTPKTMAELSGFIILLAYITGEIMSYMLRKEKNSATNLFFNPICLFSFLVLAQGLFFISSKGRSLVFVMFAFVFYFLGFMRNTTKGAIMNLIFIASIIVIAALIVSYFYKQNFFVDFPPRNIRS